MKAVDTNILVYAHRAEAREHTASLEILRNLACGNDLWIVVWPSIYEFLRVVTHPRVFSPPSTLAQAKAFLDTLMAAPSLRLAGHGPQHAAWLEEIAFGCQACGNLVFDAQIAALCLEHGATEIVTGDGDFRRFPALQVRNPFV